jgi:hypothetical protein
VEGFLRKRVWIMSKKLNRRKFLKSSIVSSASAAIAMSLEEQILLAGQATESNRSKTKAVVKGLQTGRIGDVTMSRLIIGGNLIGGWAHSRDLIYVSKLLKAYNTEEKVMETLQLCEENGVNTILVNPSCLPVVHKYRKQRGGKIQIICECHPTVEEGFRTTVQKAIDGGASLIYIQGGYGDKLVRMARMELIAGTVEFIKENGIPAGVGGHTLQVPMECEKWSVEPDFYVKTLHNDNYWSANPEEHRTEPETGDSDEHHKNHDNIWCINPQETIEFMSKVEKPWIAFKVLAAGAIHPIEGFKYAFENGADFICVGMFDFQVRNDAAIAKNVLAEVTKKGRVRVWRA